MLVNISPTGVGLMALMLGGGISLHEARFAIRKVSTWRPVLNVLKCMKCSGVSIAFYSGAANLFKQFYIFLTCHVVGSFITHVFYLLFLSCFFEFYNRKLICSFKNIF